MVAQAALGKVGIILAMDVSRLTRGNRDWYHLLDICAITDTLPTTKACTIRGLTMTACFWGSKAR